MRPNAERGVHCFRRRNFWAADGAKVVGPLQQWISTHGVTVLLARTDWEVLEDIFSWG